MYVPCAFAAARTTYWKGFDFDTCRLDQHMTPEILRTPLHELALSIKLLRLGSIGQFLAKAVEPPPIDAVIEAEAKLKGDCVGLCAGAYMWL